MVNEGDNEFLFIYFDFYGRSWMVDVLVKGVIVWFVWVSGMVIMVWMMFDKICKWGFGKGDVFEVVRFVGIMGVKCMFDLILLCYLFLLVFVEIDFEFLNEKMVVIEVCVWLEVKIGVEMEVFIVVLIVVLIIYDMCKFVDWEMVVELMCLEEKSGGKSGYFKCIE